MEVLAHFLNKVHITHFLQDNVFRFLRERDLGYGEPGPVVRVGTPGVRVLDGEGEPVVDGGDCDAGLHWGNLTVLRAVHRLLVVDQPVVVASIRVPYNVVQHHQLLKLQLQTNI